ncbi:hypothetical protein [Hyphomicrobium sp. ghe19]|uniref:hypothetical protein n=1 Tax=Hyphomicrobium sp. ghe19 TaxID=2682968 RepID=UPI00136767BA|nr:hypothetical protein HYPP_01971 [Hyphomicrobium sp. ghe19]
MSKNFPAFEVVIDWRDKAYVMWSDEKANRRFHMWVNKGVLEDQIHSNWIDPGSKRIAGTHKLLDPHSKKWAPFVNHVRAELAAGRLAEAEAVWNRQKEAERAKIAADVEAERKKRQVEAAAPDMLAALKEADTICTDLFAGERCDSPCWTVLNKLRAAIAKAEGRAQEAV